LNRHPVPPPLPSLIHTLRAPVSGWRTK
jgi:hypothetical protein